MPHRPTQQDGASDPRRHLPSVSDLLEQEAVQALVAEHSRPLALDAIHGALERYRKTLTSTGAPPDLEAVTATVVESLRRNEHDRIRPVVNATGVILHTGLGRAVLPQRAVDALAWANRCVNLQIDLDTGERGKRNYMTEQLLCKLTGAEAAMVVNNNAGATLLILAALCEGKEVIVSRGQLIEIGGSYRLPDCVHQSGAILVEVGTTNKTHLRDYERALTENTGAILRVNPSNYRVIGFSQQVPLADLVTLKEKQDVLVIDDLGCGALVNLEEHGLPHEPTAPDSIAAGADLCCFSGDKMIGGPQAGIIVGREELVSKIRRHPLTRMLRVGKLTDLALEHTLRMFLAPERLLEEHPTLRMIATPAKDLKRAAQRLKRRIDREGLPVDATVAEGESTTGGGSLPAVPIPTYVVNVAPHNLSAQELAGRLRQHDTPVIARIRDDQVALDVRTLMPGDDSIIVAALRACAGREERA